MRARALGHFFFRSGSRPLYHRCYYPIKKRNAPLGFAFYARVRVNDIVLTAFLQRLLFRETGRIAQKYTSRAANLYKERLRRECENMRRKGGGISPLQSPTDQGPKTDFFGDPLVSPKAEDTKNVKTMENYFPVSPKKNEGEEKKKEETKTKPLAASQPVHKRIAAVQTSRPKVMVSSTTRKVGLGAKKTGGLGAKKLSEKVDDRLFDQAPSEEVPSKTNSNPPSGGASPRDSSGHVALPPKSNRFAYSEDGFGDDSKKETKSTTSSKNDDGPTYTMGGLESVPVNSRRGTSGHVTLDRNAGKKTNIDTRNFGSTATSSSSSSRPPASNSTSRSAFGASPKYGNSGHGGGGFGRNTTSSASTSTNPAAVGAANDHYYNATERFAGAKSISSDAFGGGSNRSNDNDDGFGWDANRYAGESGFGSSDIRRGGTSPRGDDLDLTASDLMEKISFQAKQDAAAFKSAASRGISGLKNMASSIFDELNR